MSPLGILLTFIFCVGVCSRHRSRAALAYLGAVLYLTQGQTIDVGSINFMAIRFVEVTAFFRLLGRGEFKNIISSKVNRIFLGLFVSMEILLMLRTGEFDEYGVGNAIDACLVFFTFRTLLSSFEDFCSFLRGAAILLVPIAASMMAESLSGRNSFALLGGVPEISVFREGTYRAQGSFRNSISAGSLGATFLPIFIGLALSERRNRFLGIIGFCASFFILYASRSSGPLMTGITALAVWCCWPFRHRLRLVRLGLACMFVSLHLVMKQPVWFIFDRISGFIGGDGWHRSNLIDKFLLHWHEWWFWGMPIEATGTWAATKMPWGGVDVTNNYISIGLAGGLLPLILFIWFFVAMFSLVGSGLEGLRRQASRGSELLLYGAGGAVVAHVVNMTAVVYWDQFYVIFYSHLAIAASLAATAGASSVQPSLSEEKLFEGAAPFSAAPMEV